MNSPKSSWVTPLVKQWCVVSAILFNKFGQGMGLGHTSSLIGALQAPDSEIKINTVISSWLGTTIGLGCLLSYPVGSYLMARFGRKVAYISMNIPAIVGFILTAYAHSVAQLLIGNIVFGVCVGSSGALSAMIIGEFASPEHRGMFLVLNTAFLNLGSLVVHLVSNYIGWRTLTKINIIPFVAAIIITCFWPESPHWLAEQQRFRKSEQVFYWLRGKTAHSTKEINEIIQNNQIKKIRKTLSERCIEFLMKFKKRNFTRPFIIIIFGTIMFESGGRHYIPVYSSIILQGMTSKDENFFYYTLIMDIIITLSVFLSAYLVRKFRIRPYLLITGAATVIMLNLACLFLYLVSKGILAENYAWLPLGSFCLYMIVCNISCTTVPLSLVGEIFPPEHRATGVSAYGYTFGTIFTATMNIVPYLLEKFNTYGTFPILSLILFISLLAMYIMLPETKNKTLQEIGDFFTYGKHGKNIRKNDGNDEAGIEMLTKKKNYV